MLTHLILTGLRVEFLKSRARVRRWNEQLQRVPEEMRRTIAFLQHKAKWWQQRATQRPCSDPVLSEGLRAYAYRQAAIRTKLADKFTAIWEKRTASQADAADDDDEEGDAEEEDIDIVDGDEDAAELLAHEDIDDVAL